MNSRQGSDETTSIHVLIANLTGIVAERVEQTVRQQSDIQLLGSVNAGIDVDAIVAEADVLVFGANDVYSPPEKCLQILSNYPNLKILVLTTTGDEAIAYWQALHCHQIQITSSDTLIESIRQINSLSPF